MVWVGMRVCVCTHGHVCACVCQLVVAEDSALSLNERREVGNYKTTARRLVWLG